MAGFGDHLPLDDEEQADWARANDLLAKSSKSKGMKAAKRAVEKWAPYLAYATTAGVIFIPRAILTVETIRQKRVALAAARARAAQTTQAGAEGATT